MVSRNRPSACDADSAPQGGVEPTGLNAAQHTDNCRDTAVLAQRCNAFVNATLPSATPIVPSGPHEEPGETWLDLPKPHGAGQDPTTTTRQGTRGPGFKSRLPD